MTAVLLYGQSRFVRAPNCRTTHETPTGRRVARRCASVVAGALSYAGQFCISVQRAFVHRSIAGEFVERLRTATEALRIGHPYEESTDISSLIDEAEAVRIEKWIEEAVAGGARVATGG